MNTLRSLTLARTFTAALVLVGRFPASLFAQSETSPAQPAASEGLLPVTNYGGDWRTRIGLSGDWNDLRQNWAEHGFTVDFRLTQYGQGIESGGSDEGWEFGGSGEALFRADLSRMAIVPGALVTLRAESRYGDSVNGKSGLLLPVDTQSFFPLTELPDDDIPIAITELNYTQFLSQHAGVIVGKVQTLDGDPNEFAGGRGRSQFMNFAFVANPVTALTVPYSTLGAGVVLLPSDSVTISSILMNLTDSSTSSGFDDFGKGAVWSTEADFQRKSDLPGGVNVGGTYAFDADFTDLDGKLEFIPGVGPALQSESTSWCVYASAWQYLRMEDEASERIRTNDGRPDLQGLGLFTRLGFADHDTNPIDWSASLGLGGRGLIDGRGDDCFGLGYFYTSLQQPRSLLINRLGDHTQGLELFYDMAFARSVSLTLDGQWVAGAFNDIDDAVLIGLRLNVCL
jgi:porin